MTPAVAVHRLALGLEPRDAVGGGRVAGPLYVLRDGAASAEDTLLHLGRTAGTVGGGLSVLDPHPSGRHALRYRALPGGAVPDHVDVRLVEEPGRRPPRRFVPRRLRLPLEAPDDADARALGFRVRRPRLFPGAAYPLPPRATGLRGFTLRGGEPARWARVEAVRPGGSDVLARAHGDDRGEFLLVLGPEARPPGELEEEVTVEVRVFLPDPAPEADPAALAGADPLWDLPLEVVPDGEDDDPVTLGAALPGGYTATATREVDIPLGRILSADPFEP